MSTLSGLQSMNPYEFESLVGEIWKEKGYDTNVRQGSNDKAIDVEAVSGNHKILIQAKRYSFGNKVGGPEVRKYATLYQQEPDANQVIIVTTSDFTTQAKEIAAEQNVELINGRQFIEIVNKHNGEDRSSSVSKQQNSESSDSNEVIERLGASAAAAGIIVGVTFLIIDSAIFGGSLQLQKSSSENTLLGNIIGVIWIVFTIYIYVIAPE